MHRPFFGRDAAEVAAAEKELSNQMFRAFVAPDRFGIPPELRYAHWLHETGWPPDVLDKVGLDTLEKLMLYRRIVRAIEIG